MKSKHFFLSPLLYALLAAGIAAEVFLFLPDSSRHYLAAPGMSTLGSLVVDAVVLAVLAFLLTAVVSVKEGILVLRVCGVPLSRTPISTITTVTTAFPFMALQREDGGRNKPRFCPSLRSREVFLAVLLEVNPAILIEVGRRDLKR